MRRDISVEYFAEELSETQENEVLSPPSYPTPPNILLMSEEEVKI